MTTNRPMPEAGQGSLPLAIRPLQWATLPELDEAGPLNASDHACMVELAAVLARHGKLDRFALHLAHKHFDLAAGEVLLERSDPDNRTQHVTVAQLDQVEHAVPTTWLLDTAPDMQAGANMIYCVCVTPPTASACARHGKSQAPSEGTQKEWAERDRGIAERNAKYKGGRRPKDQEQER